MLTASRVNNASFLTTVYIFHLRLPPTSPIFNFIELYVTFGFGRIVVRQYFGFTD